MAGRSDEACGRTRPGESLEGRRGHRRAPWSAAAVSAHSSTSRAYAALSTQPRSRCRADLTPRVSQRIPSRSMIRSDAWLSAKADAVTRRTPRSSKQIREQLAGRLGGVAVALVTRVDRPADLRLAVDGLLRDLDLGPAGRQVEVELPDHDAVQLEHQGAGQESVGAHPQQVVGLGARARTAASRRPPAGSGSGRAPRGRRGSRAGRRAARSVGARRSARRSQRPPSRCDATRSTRFRVRPRRAPLLGEHRRAHAVDPAQVAVQRVAPATALDRHPDPLHHPQRGGVVGEGTGGHPSQAEPVEADPQQLGRALGRVALPGVRRVDAPADLRLRCASRRRPPRPGPTASDTAR